MTGEPGLTGKLSPMQLSFDPERVAELRDGLARWRGRRVRPQTTKTPWAQGVPGPWLEELLADWCAFDVSAFEERVSLLDHRLARQGDRSVHVVVATGKGADPLPLLLCNGWPSSFCEYLDVLPLLTEPGGRERAFTVVMPAMPGFGFSAPPPTGGVSRLEVADQWTQLMTECFGFDTFVAHGSDLGAGVVAQIGKRHPDHVAAMHLATPGWAPAPRPWTPAESTYAAEVERWTAGEGAYAHLHATRPETLSAALLDSPVGLAAWIGEKFRAWSSGDDVSSRQLLLETLTLYWVTASIGTSMLPYWNSRQHPETTLSPDDPGPVPTSVSIFGGEAIPLPHPPRELARRYVNIARWEEHATGGHFPAAAEPELFAASLRRACASR